MAFWKDSMINRLSNIINRNRSTAKISQVLCSTTNGVQILASLSEIMGKANAKDDENGERSILLAEIKRGKRARFLIQSSLWFQMGLR